MSATANLPKLATRLGLHSIRLCATTVPDSGDVPYYLTTESNPANHTKKHLGRMYRLPKELIDRFPEPTGGWSDRFLPPDFMRQVYKI